MTTITKTYRELLICEDNGLALFGTPNSNGELGGFYWGSSPSWQNDECVATPHDFLEAAGYDSFCRDADYLEECGDEEYSLDV